ncbi:MAG: universal stress protein [Chloroflexota bacterium]|nr:universal stress protein [Chloroflexota bacterium]
MRTLVCVADMPFAAPTVRYAGVISRLMPGVVTVLNVSDQPVDETEARETLSQAMRLLPGLEIEGLTLQGKPEEQIAHHIETNNYDLVIMGERESGLTDLFPSSVVRSVANRVPAPIMVVKRERPSVERILLCLAGRENENGAVSLAARLAMGANARVTLLHVTDPLPSLYTGLATMEEKLAELLQTDTPVAQHLRKASAAFVDREIPTVLKLRHGSISHEILAEAEERNYDLIVIGRTQPVSRIRRLWTRDVSKEVFDNARCPVLSVAHR